MKLKSFALGSALMAMLALGVVGCNENPVDDVVIPTAPSNVQAVSLSTTSVGLTWTASSSSPVTYVVSVDGAAVDTVGTTSATVTGLAAGSHTFLVKAMNTSGTQSTSGASVVWAGATRSTHESSAPTVTLKLYEFAAPPPLGSGLGLDGVNGPRNISTASGVLGDVQLAIFMKDNNTFDIGAAAGFDEYANRAQFDQNVFLSDSSYVVSSMDSWYNSKSLEDYIVEDNSWFYNFNNAGAQNQGFYVRTGANPTTAHYSRVLVKSVGGKLVQGTAPNRFVEVEVSYQATAGVPYAKMAVGQVDPPGSVAGRSGRLGH